MERPRFMVSVQNKEKGM